ncbi:unnamed protein product [Amoebophrya sp. A120]|nr:unnamed protein product [Amoebophrya sp. A120]|eukprot:GSA120T00016865001.1
MVSAFAYFAAGCFWGVEFLFEKLDGVKTVESGYMGGASKNPSYKQVSTGRSGHLEAVKIEYDPAAISYAELVKFLFEIHDPAQVDRQGPDVGPQYASRIWWSSDEERQDIEFFVRQLEGKGVKVATTYKTHRAQDHTFWPAEEYHQNYYEGNGHTPYCHAHKDKGLSFDSHPRRSLLKGTDTDTEL